MNSRVSEDRPTDPIIEVVDLGKSYSNGSGVITVLSRVDLNIHPSEMVAIMGPSGSGKTTLMAILGLFLSPSRGIYRVLGENVLELGRSAQAEFRRNSIGFVFQGCNLIENSTVYENLEFPLIYAGMKRSERRGRIVESLERVSLGHRVRHRSNLLSGGEQQRVAIARALVNRPRIILADEPTGQLDRQNGQLVMDYFQKLAENGDASILLVTHDREVADRCHRIHTLADGVLSLEPDRGRGEDVLSEKP